jgi:hypothetical protein
MDQIDRKKNQQSNKKLEKNIKGIKSGKWIEGDIKQL